MSDETQNLGEPQDPTAGAGVEAPADDLEALLADYNQQTTPQDAGYQQRQDAGTDYDPYAYDPQSQEISGLRNDVNELRQNQAAQLDRHDIEAVIAHGEQMLREADIPVSDGWVRRFIASEAALNPELTRAFDSRYESQDNLNVAEKLVRKALSKMRAEAKAMPDRDATADRNAVMAAMKTTANNYGRVPEEKLPDFASMTDNEFFATRRRMFKF